MDTNFKNSQIMNVETCQCGSGKPQMYCCSNIITELKSDFKPGVRYKGGIKYDSNKKAFLVIIHSWDNTDCRGKPTEFALPHQFKEEEEAMDHYKNHVRPILLDLIEYILKLNKNTKIKRTKLE